MSTEVLFTALALLSALTTLTVEGIKKLLDEAGKSYAPNLLAAIVAIVLTVVASICYIIYAGIAVDARVIVEAIAMVFMSFLCSTVGFDKVKQMIMQILGKN